MNYESWPLLRSTFPSTGGNGIMIKGYDPVIVGGKCITTFMAVTPGDKPQVFANVAEFEAVAVAGGTLCRDRRVASLRRQYLRHDAVPVLLQGRRVPRVAVSGERNLSSSSPALIAAPYACASPSTTP